MTKDKPANRLCVCGHTAEKHWLAGGELIDPAVLHRSQGRAPWTRVGGNGSQLKWPRYYRAECIKCDCEGFVEMRKRKTA